MTQQTTAAPRLVPARRVQDLVQIATNSIFRARALTAGALLLIAAAPLRDEDDRQLRAQSEPLALRAGEACNAASDAVDRWQRADVAAAAAELARDVYWHLETIQGRLDIAYAMLNAMHERDIHECITQAMDLYTLGRTEASGAGVQFARAFDAAKVAT